MNKVIITMDDGSTIVFRNENGLSEKNMFKAIFNGVDGNNVRFNSVIDIKGDTVYYRCDRINSIRFMNS